MLPGAVVSVVAVVAVVVVDAAVVAVGATVLLGTVDVVVGVGHPQPGRGPRASGDMVTRVRNWPTLTQPGTP